MPEDDTKKWEDENLNSNGQDNEWGEDQKTTYTAEEVDALKKQMQSDSEKGVQKVIGQKKAYEIAMQNLSEISDEPWKLVELYEENPKAAQVILDTYYDGQNIESFKESIEYEEDYSNPDRLEKLVEKKTQERVETKLIEDTKSMFIEKLKITGEELTKFEDAFSERKELKSFKADDTQKHLEKAYRDISDNDEALKELKKQEAIANSMATSTWKGGKESQWRKQTAVKKNSEYNRNFLKERWIL